jgi:probable rRNA maturation factor
VILQLVDRRSRITVDPYDWLGGVGPTGILTCLAGRLGRPRWTADLVLVDADTMAAVNEKFRQVPGVTDVLSFSYLEETGPGEPDLTAGQGHAFTNLWLDTLSSGQENGTVPTVGEIILAPSYVAERCLRQGWSLEHENALLVVHGLLHLLGWDHADAEQTEAMRAIEEAILAACGLPHPLRERS